MSRYQTELIRTR